MPQSIYGKRNDDVVRDFFGDTLPREEVLARGAAKEVVYREMIGERIEQILVQGLRPFLENYRNDPMALASNAERANVDFILDRARLRRYFRTVVDGHQVHHPKPHPEIYLLTAALLGVPSANCVVFEDSFWGVEAARSAGARVIGLRTTHEDLPGVALAIDNFEDRELEPWLQAQKPLA
jgi:beta-phosphoglucomutase